MNRLIYIFPLILTGLIIRPSTGYAQSIPGNPNRITGNTQIPPGSPVSTDPSQPMELVFVHTDKDTYLAGEIGWLKCYVVDAATHRPLGLSHSAFVEILSAEKKPVLQARIPLDSGMGTASFQLPFSLHTGNYSLRVYTNWMKNFPAGTWFQKPLTILNTLRNNPRSPTTPPAKPYDIQFFPEGGNLIANTPNHIAFRIIDSSGKGIACSGTVVASTGDTVTRFDTQRFGMGEFIITPSANTRYTAIINPSAGPGSTQLLPAAETAGYTMHVSDAGSGQLRIEVRAGAQTQNKSVRLLMSAHHPLSNHEIPLTSDRASFLINKDSLTDGITWLTILAGDTNGQFIPVCERGWFKPPMPLKFNVRTDQTTYRKRERITVDLSTLDTNNLPLRLHGSVAVVLQDSVQTTGEQDIVNYFLLTSELRGTVESPGYYFAAQNSDRETIASLLLMTQGWRRLRLSPSNARHLPEYGGLLVWGHITDRQSGAPAPGISAWLSAPGQHFQLARSTSDKNGDIAWDMGDLYGARELVVQTTNADSNYRIDINSPFADPASASSSPSPYTIPTVSSAQLLRHSIGAQAQNAYRTALYQQFTRTAPADTTAFFGHPDRRYILDDYTRFTTMEEVIREYVKTVKLKEKKGGFEFNVQSDQANQLFFDESPLILLDGVPTSNATNIVRFDPLKMQKIEVVAKRYFVGGNLYDGIVSCNTYQGDITGFALDAGAYTLDYDGWQLHREFYSPIYDTKEKQDSRIPDLRNTLFWSGDILTDPQGRQQLSFYASDMPGRYLILLQGITTGGKAGAAIGQFNVQ